MPIIIPPATPASAFTKAEQVINRAYTLLGIKDPGQAMDGTMMADALDVLNTMIDSWRTEEFFVYETAECVYTMTPGQQVVTIGPGADIDTPVPLKIERGGFTRSGQMDYSFDLIDRVQYNDITMKSTGTTWPTCGYYERAYPVASLFLYPVPTGAYELHLPVWLPLSGFADLQTNYLLPPGYRRALEYSLAEELAPGLAEVPGYVTKTAAQARRNVKRVNRETPILDVPAELQVGRRFNIFSGQ